MKAENINPDLCPEKKFQSVFEFATASTSLKCLPSLLKKGNTVCSDQHNDQLYFSKGSLLQSTIEPYSLDSSTQHALHCLAFLYATVLGLL
jgi:hypothetical protein